MRRAIALTLLVLFSYMLMAPLFAPNAEASLPPCCRRHGRHHCMMQRLLAMSGKPGGPPAIQEKCPFSSKRCVTVQVRLPRPETEPQAAAGTVTAAAPVACGVEPRERPFFDSYPKRGPPTPLT